MLRKPMVVLAIALALGSSAVPASAFARERGGAPGGSAFGSSDFGGCFGGGRTTRAGCVNYGDRVNGLHGGSDHGYQSGDVWGHWGGYYGPMVH
jgi:hypothetical protein